MSYKEFLFRLFFTRNDDLDILQVLFALIVVVTLILIVYMTVHKFDSTVLIEALLTLRWMIGLLVVTAVPRWLIPSVLRTLTTRNKKPRHTE